MADVAYNQEQIIEKMKEAAKLGAKLIVFPELCVTGYTCSDLFEHEILLNAAKQALFEIAEETKEIDALVFVGAPLAVDGKLYNVATAMNQGKILGLISKTFLPNYGEFYEMRQFTPGPKTDREILVGTGSFCGNLRGCMVTDSAEYSGGDGGGNRDRQLFGQ